MKEKNKSLVTNYWKSADLETLHRYSQKWLSETAFWEDELLFMQNLMQKHFLYFFEKERLSVVNELEHRLSTTLKKELKRLEKEVQQHEHQLARYIKSPNDWEEKMYREEQAKLDEKMKTFEVDFKNTKQELFQVAEDVLKDEKMKRFLTSAG